MPGNTVISIKTGNILSLIILGLVLQACAARRGLELPELSDFDTRRSVLESIDRFEFTGRIGVSAGNEGFNGKLRWWQEADDFKVTVSGPLGVGTVRIEADGQRISLTDKNGDVTEMLDAEQELKMRYGWTIPVTSLRYWALGIPDPTIEATTEFADDGLLSGLEQRGWSVIIGQYRDGGGQPMPGRITAVNDNTKVRLIIDNWSFY